jgi:hypothetical protein
MPTYRSSHKPGRKCGVRFNLMFRPIKLSNRGERVVSSKEGAMSAKFSRRHIRLVVGLAFVAFASLVLLLAASSPATVASAQGCSANSFSMDPVPPGEGYALGTHVVLQGSSNCGTVKFNIKNLDNGQSWDKAETGQSNQTEVWKTEETNTGTFEVCFLARGDGGWENASKMCRTVYVKGGQGPTAGPVDISQFSVTPSTIVEGQGSFSMVGMGHGPNGIRATKFTVDNQDWNESSNGTNRADWSPGTGDHTICFLVTSGDWNNGNETAKQCVSVTVLPPGNPTPTPNVIVPVKPTDVPPVIIEPVGTVHPELRESHGGIFVHIYCQLNGHPAPTSEPSDGDTYWRCGDGADVDFNLGCRMAYGPNSTSFIDWNYTPRKYSVRCTQSGVNPPPPKERTPVPTVVPPSGTCGSAPAPQFTPGMRGIVTDTEPEWVSDRASFVKADGANHINDLPPNMTFTVREGPVCGRGISGRTWFYQVSADNGVSGWIAEGYSEYWIRPISGNSPKVEPTKEPDPTRKVYAKEDEWSDQATENGVAFANVSVDWVVTYENVSPGTNRLRSLVVHYNLVHQDFSLFCWSTAMAYVVDPNGNPIGQYKGSSVLSGPRIAVEHDDTFAVAPFMEYPQGSKLHMAVTWYCIDMYKLTESERSNPLGSSLLSQAQDKFVHDLQDAYLPSNLPEYIEKEVDLP